MKTISTTTDGLFREIKKIAIYPSEDYPFADSTIGKEIHAEPLLVFEPINPEDFERKIIMKTQQGNRFWEYTISFVVDSVGTHHRETLYGMLNKRGFAAMLYANEEKTVLGNSHYPLTIEVDDGIREDSTGRDVFIVSIKGYSIFPPLVIGY